MDKLNNDCIRFSINIVLLFHYFYGSGIAD